MRHVHDWILEYLTCPEVHDEIKQEDSVGDAIEYDPMDAEVIVEERNGHREHNQVGHQQDQHEQIPVEPGNKNSLNSIAWLYRDGLAMR